MKTTTSASIGSVENPAKIHSATLHRFSSNGLTRAKCGHFCAVTPTSGANKIPRFGTLAVRLPIAQTAISIIF